MLKKIVEKMDSLSRVIRQCKTMADEMNYQGPSTTFVKPLLCPPYVQTHSYTTRKSEQNDNDAKENQNFFKGVTLFRQKPKPKHF